MKYLVYETWIQGSLYRGAKKVTKSMKRRMDKSNSKLLPITQRRIMEMGFEQIKQMSKDMKHYDYFHNDNKHGVTRNLIYEKLWLDGGLSNMFLTQSTIDFLEDLDPNCDALRCLAPPNDTMAWTVSVPFKSTYRPFLFAMVPKDKFVDMYKSYYREIFGIPCPRKTITHIEDDFGFYISMEAHNKELLSDEAKQTHPIECIIYPKHKVSDTPEKRFDDDLFAKHTKLAANLVMVLNAFPEVLTKGLPKNSFIPKKPKDIKEISFNINIKKSEELSENTAQRKTHYRRPHFAILRHPRYRRNPDGSPRVVMVSGCMVNASGKMYTADVEGK